MSNGLCGALFETPNGTGICELFGQHDHHEGIVASGVFRCHACRLPIVGVDPFRFGDMRQCRCVLGES